MNDWKKPEFVEIRMDAEINCYSSALGTIPGASPEAAVDSRRRIRNQPGILRPAVSAGPYSWFRGRRRLPAVELQLRQLRWTEDRGAACESADPMLGSSQRGRARDGRC